MHPAMGRDDARLAPRKAHQFKRFDAKVYLYARAPKGLRSSVDMRGRIRAAALATVVEVDLSRCCVVRPRELVAPAQGSETARSR